MIKQKSQFNKTIQLNELLPIVILIGIGFVVRVVYWQSYINNMPYALQPQNDAKMYWELGVTIFRKGWLLPEMGPYYQAPLYAYFLAILHHIGIHRVIEVLQIQMLLGLINMQMLYGLARFKLSRWWALVVAIMFGCAHFTIFYESKILATTLGVSLLLLFSFAYTLWIQKHLIYYLIISAFIFALVILCRPNYLFTLPFLVIHLFIFSNQHTILKRFIAPFIFTLTFILCVSPALLRNGLVANDWVFISANSGVTLYMGNNPQAQGALGAVEGLSNNIAEQHQGSIDLAERLSGKSLLPSEASAFWKDKTKEWILNNPIDFIILLCKKTLWGFYHIPPSVNYSSIFESQFVSILKIFMIISVITIALGWVGLPVFILRKDPISSYWVCIIGGYFLLTWVFYASDRFLVGVFPFVALIAVYFIASCHQYIQNRFNALLKPKRLLFVGWVIIAILLTVNPWLGWNKDNEIAMGYYNLGVMQRDEGDVQSAQQAFEQGLKVNPRMIPLLLNLGVIYAQRGQLEQSTQLFKRVLELDPNHQTAHRNLEINQQRMQR